MSLRALVRAMPGRLSLTRQVALLSLIPMAVLGFVLGLAAASSTPARESAGAPAVARSGA